jgi:hypothetical protein
MLQNFRIDFISFLIGFITACLFWLLVSRFNPLFPLLKSRIMGGIRNFRQRNLEGADHYLRMDTIRRAQRMHITAEMFALDEILVPPMLIAPPVQIEHDMAAPHLTVASQTIPYMPDWPELAANMTTMNISIGTVLQKGASIAVIGQPGAGKTVALAALACQMARKDPELGRLQEFLPIHLHILDLAPDLLENVNPLNAIIKAISPRANPIIRSQMTRLITLNFHQGSAILILDGLDELHPTALSQAAKYLKLVREKYPNIQIVAAASPYYQDGLTDLDLIPLGLAAWGAANRYEFLDLWKEKWALYIEPEIAKTPSLSPIPHLLIDNWLRGERGLPSPLEWTLKVWGAYAGDLRLGLSTPYETIIAHNSLSLLARDSAELIAQEFLIKGQAALPYQDLVNLITKQAAATPAFVDELSASSQSASQTPVKGKTPEKRDLILSVGEKAIENLVKGGLLVEHAGSLLRFMSPSITGYLAAPGMKNQIPLQVMEHPLWAPSHQLMRFVAAIGENVAWIETFVKQDDGPLLHNLLAAARWLGDSTSSAPWRAIVFRNLANNLNNEELPFSLRGRMAAAFVCSNDPSAPKLFKKLLTTNTPSVRILSALGIGAWGDPALITDLTDLIHDEEESIRNAACMGLVSLHTETALHAVADCLLNGDESIRQAAAEALVFLPNQGVEIIREAVKLNDLLARRAAVFGLMQIREPWAKQMLDQIAVEDGQWVVRNAAAQAIETIQEIDHRVPKAFPPPHEATWLISFAGKRGLGLSAVQPATDVLLLALKAGTLEDQIASLRYLKNVPQENVIQAVYGTFYGEQPSLKDAALLTIWNWALGGVKLPFPSIVDLKYTAN